MTGVLEMFTALSSPDAFDAQYQLELFAWAAIERVGHGYDAYVNYGCRCAICRAANRDYMRGYLARRYGHVTKREYRCSGCGAMGHSARTCVEERRAA